MNRAQRRKMRAVKPLVPSAEVPSGTLNNGDHFTIKGLKLNPDGSITRDCKPGQETEFVAKVVA